eukprot:6132330-Amphidinium_carterae.1
MLWHWERVVCALDCMPINQQSELNPTAYNQCQKKSGTFQALRKKHTERPKSLSASGILKNLRMRCGAIILSQRVAHLVS